MSYPVKGIHFTRPRDLNDPNSKLAWSALSDGDSQLFKSKLKDCKEFKPIKEYVDMTPLMVAGWAGRVDVVCATLDHFKSQIEKAQLYATTPWGFNFMHCIAMNGEKKFRQVADWLSKNSQQGVLESKTMFGHTPEDIAALVHGTYMKCLRQDVQVTQDCDEKKEEPSEEKKDAVSTQIQQSSQTGRQYIPGFRMRPESILSVYLRSSAPEDLPFLSFTRGVRHPVCTSPDRIEKFFANPPRLRLVFHEDGSRRLVANGSTICEGDIVCVTGGRVEHIQQQNRLVSRDSRKEPGFRDMVGEGISNAMVVSAPSGKEGFFLIALKNIGPREEIRVEHGSASIEKSRSRIVDETFFRLTEQPGALKEFYKLFGHEKLPNSAYRVGKYLLETPIGLLAVILRGGVTPEDKELYQREVKGINLEELQMKGRLLFSPDATLEDKRRISENSPFHLALICCPEIKRLTKNHQDICAMLEYLGKQEEPLSKKYSDCLMKWTQKYSQGVLFSYLGEIPRMWEECEKEKIDPSSYVEGVLDFCEEVIDFSNGGPGHLCLWEDSDVTKEELRGLDPKIPEKLFPREKKFLADWVQAQHTVMKKGLQVFKGSSGVKREYIRREQTLYNLGKELNKKKG